jgi:hypothetical protein
MKSVPRITLTVTSDSDLFLVKCLRQKNGLGEEMYVEGELHKSRFFKYRMSNILSRIFNISHHTMKPQ